MEPIRQGTVVAIEEETQVAVARRAVRESGLRLGLAAATIGRAEIVVAELANNILQHAGTNLGGRQIVIGSTPSGDALQIVAMDKGPGIASVERAFVDGYSTASTPGLGLGAAGRLTQQFDLYSELGKGVVASACIADVQPPHAAPEFRASVLSTPIHGERVNGDSWSVQCVPGREIWLMADGLGHGAQAAEASNLATALFNQGVERNPNILLSDLMQQMHNPMRATRGAATMLISVDYARMEVTCCGVGNISCVLAAADGVARSLVSHNGTLGHQMRRVQEFVYPFAAGSLLVMHSDGLSTHWKISGYQRLFERATATIAGVLYRDAARLRDDATVMVARLASDLASDLGAKRG